jgi:phosphoribosyl 1,2-cyclic phosphodiesterase
MEELGLDGARIEGVLLTHEHADHIGAARVLDARLTKKQGQAVPFFCTAGTDMGLPSRCRPTEVARIQSGQAFQLGRFVIEPFTVPHDTRDPVAYCVQHGDTRAGVITDLGRSTRLVERMVSQLDICVLEFNHDLQMLMEGPYPWRLKQRVRGAHGHLSNAQAAALLRQGASAKLRHLVLAHLSDDNNEPDVAREAAEAAVHAAGLRRVSVHVAEQKVAKGPFEVRAPLPLREPTRRAKPRRSRPEVQPPAVATSQLGMFAG